MTDNKEHTRYLSTDISRVICRKETYLSILGITLAMFFSVGNADDFTESVTYMFLLAASGVGFILVFVFSAIPYGMAYSDELENQYIRYLVSRGSLKKYVASKTIVIFVSSILAVGMGGVFFALLCSLKLPWMDGYTMDSLKGTCGYVWLLEQKKYLLWYAICGIQWGILSGCLSLAAAYVSLFISNRLLVLAIPAFLYQAIIELGTGTFRRDGRLDPMVIFDAQAYLFQNDGKMLAWAVFTGTLLAFLLGVASYFRIKKRM